MIKIRNVPIEVCSAEQKIAYNIAFNVREFLVKDENNLELANKIVDRSISERFDKEMIKEIIRKSRERYCAGRSVLGSYEEIGNIFKIN